MSRLGVVSAGRRPGPGCWLCERFSAADALMVGSGSMASLSACELFGEDHRAWGPDGHVDESCADLPRLAAGPGDR